jgi:trehalose/maltose hydrolase-like predicted phosphorylase
VIGQDVFAVESWAVPERELHLELLPQTESIFALSNGHIGLRGNLDEGEPSGAPGTFLNGFYEVRPLPYAEAGYGYPEAGQTMINVTNGKVNRLLVDDEPFDVRYGKLVRHERVLDLRDGVLRREVEWVSPAGQAVRVRTMRLVSFVQRSVAAILYEVEPLGAGARIVVQSELVANEPVPEPKDDPRAAAALRAALVAEQHTHHELRAGLVHRARASATMDLAQARAHELGLKGVAFPWRTIRGQECSGYWPAGTAAFHINADVADAVRRYLAATGDEEFEQGPGLELLVETARLWRSLGHHDADGGFRIDGVTGPDEYTAIVDNNVYTNLLAARNLLAAAELAVRHPQRAAELGVDQEEIAGWRDAAGAVVIPFDDDLKVTAQCEGFTRYRQWDFETTTSDEYPLLLNFHNYLLYSSQVVKQADLVFALYACGDCFDAEQKARDFDYYERITVRDSSLSAAIQAIVAAEVGHLDLAYDYFGETAFIDLRDLAFNTRDGLHLASLAGTWLVAVAGFGGMRDHGDALAFSPRLPPRLARLTFRLLYRGRRLRVDVRSDSASYELLDGQPLELLHHGERVTVASGAPQWFPCPPPPRRAKPEPPPARKPPRRHREA